MKKITDDTIKAIWAEQNLEAKKDLLLDVIDNFQYKSKQEHFREAVRNTKSTQRLDFLSKDIFFVGYGMKIV